MTNDDYITENTESQCDCIEGHLRKGEAITALDALNLCGCFRLAARIHDLKHKRGLDIVTEKLTTNTGKKVAAYRLASRQYSLAL